MPRLLQVDNIFVFIRQVAPVPACWLFKTSATSWPLTFWPWEWCPSHVWRVPILVFLGLSVLDLGPMYAAERCQTDVRRASLLNASALLGWGLACLLFNGTFSTNRLYHAIEVWCIPRRAGEQHKYHAVKHNKPTQYKVLFGLDFMEMIPSPRWGFLRGVFLANHLASNDNLTRTTKRQNTYNEN